MVGRQHMPRLLADTDQLASLQRQAAQLCMELPADSLQLQVALRQAQNQARDRRLSISSNRAGPAAARPSSSCWPLLFPGWHVPAQI